MKETNILYILIMIIVAVHLIGNYTNHLNTSNLQNTIVQHEQKIIELKNKNITCVQHCEEIVKIDNEIILRMSNMFRKFDTYIKQPELMILDASVLASSTEQNIKLRNVLLDNLDIEYNEPIYR